MVNSAEHSTCDVVLFGGTFDPPHAGHIACVSHVRQLFPSALVEILPSPAAMTTGGGMKQPGASFAQRLAMCRLAFQVDGELTRVNISDLEAQLPPPYYTVNLVRQYMTTHPGRRVALLIGMDQWRNFAHWYDAKGILAISDLVIVKRANESMSELCDNLPWPNLTRARQMQLPGVTAQSTETRHTIYFIDKETSEATSCEIRTMMRTGQQPPPGWLPPEVARTIETWGLYK